MAKIWSVYHISKHDNGKLVILFSHKLDSSRNFAYSEKEWAELCAEVGSALKTAKAEPDPYKAVCQSGQETDEIDECEKCGEEVGRRMIGDEFYRNCPDCGMAIEQ